MLIAEPGRPPSRAFFERAPAEWRFETQVEAGPPRVELHSLRRRPAARAGSA